MIENSTATEKLFSVLSDGTVDELAELLASGADPSATDEDGYPALLAALLEPEMVSLLIDAGASVHVKFGGWMDGEWREGLSAVEIICSLYQESDEYDRSMFALDWSADLEMLLAAGADPFVRMKHVPEEFTGLISSYTSARTLEEMTLTVAAPDRVVRL